MRQGELRFTSERRGGRREGAGRPKRPDSGVPHVRRAALASRYPVHATLRLLGGLPSLRRKATHAVLRRALAAGRDRNGLRLAHFSIQRDHLHLIVEAKDRTALARGMQGLSIRLAKALNRAWGRKGTVFADRYHAEILRSPRQVRNALAYVLRNGARHGVPRRGIDDYSSGPWFDGWEEEVVLVNEPDEPRPIARARTWLLTEGWRRHGPIPFDHVPGRAADRRRARSRTAG